MTKPPNELLLLTGILEENEVIIFIDKDNHKHLLSRVPLIKGKKYDYLIFNSSGELIQEVKDRSFCLG